MCEMHLSATPESCRLNAFGNDAGHDIAAIRLSNAGEAR